MNGPYRIAVLKGSADRRKVSRSPFTGSYGLLSGNSRLEYPVEQVSRTGLQRGSRQHHVEVLREAGCSGAPLIRQQSYS